MLHNLKWFVYHYHEEQEACYSSRLSLIITHSDQEKSVGAVTSVLLLVNMMPQPPPPHYYPACLVCLLDGWTGLLVGACLVYWFSVLLMVG